MKSELKDNRGKLIIIEGGDASGKNTQAKLLLKHLQRQGFDIELISFPLYDTPFGTLVAKYLRGEFGSMSEVPIEIPSLLYALDRYQVKNRLENTIQGGKWIIADRYTQSNLAHQGAKLAGDEREKFINWILAVERRLPQPDLVMYLHVPVEISKKLMESRAHKSYLSSETTHDIHEQDTEYQNRVVDMYLKLSNKHENWVVIDCLDKSGNKLESIEIIHHRLLKVLEEKLGVKKHH
jgi:dTMP kinase